MKGSLLTLALLACASASCTPSIRPSTPPLETTAGHSSTAAVVTTPSPAEILDAIRFRRAFGLREDEPWVIAVAANPLAAEGLRSFGVPLMPFETADLASRPQIGSETVTVMQRYGAAVPEAFGGVFFDQQRRGIVTGNFVGDLEHHRAILQRLMPGAQFEVRQVQRSLATLRQLIRDVEAERDWFASADVRLLSAELDEIGNQVSLLYLGRVDAIDKVRQHFGDPDWLQVRRAGAGPWRGALGNLTIIVIDDEGDPVAGMDCSIYAEDPEATVGEIGYGTGEDGRCKIKNLAASTYLVEVGRERPSEGYVVVATGRVNVSAGTTSTIEITVPD